MCPFDVSHTEIGTNYCSFCESPCHTGSHNITKLTVPLQNQSTLCGKEAEIDDSSHSYCTLCSHQPLTISAQNEQTKIFQNERLLCCSECVSQ